jgi:Ca2+-binding RTX toxin-like protein
VESLERRELLSVQLIDTFNAGSYLRINGGSGADTITLAQNGTSLTVIDNGAVSNWNVNSFTHVQVSLNAGDDRIDSFGPVTEPVLVYAGDGDDTIYTGDGNDTVYGGWGDDRVYGRNGNDLLYGRESTAYPVFLVAPDTDNDIISGNGGNDTAYGGEGNDNVFGDAGNDLVGGDVGDDYVWGGDGGDAIFGGDGVDRLYGQLGTDFVVGGAGNDFLYGNEDGDTIWGQQGNDSIYGHAGADSILAGDGVDTVYGGDSNDTIYGDDGDDTIYGESGDDDLHGGDGVDYITGYYGNDTLNGDADTDWLLGEYGDDFLYGYTGNDYLFGGYNNDTLYGYTGNDFLSGDDGDDSLSGYSGDDDLYGGNGADDLDGGSDDDLLEGGDHNDNLEGSTGNDTLRGQNGDDNLYGSGGEDVLDGGAGDDGLYGGIDQDTLTGGSGSDRFLEHTWIDSFIPPGYPFPVPYLAWGASMTDFADEDARIGFQDGEQQTFHFAGQDGAYTYAGGTWLQSEIETIDSALAVLHHTTGNDNLLEKSDGSGMFFRRYGDLIAATGSFSAGAVNAGSYIGFFANTFGGTGDQVRATVFHEVGHNWDTEYDAVGWQSLSGWVHSATSPGPEWTQAHDASGEWWYLTSHQNDFARDYGRTNPNEDFATCFGSYFMGLAGLDASPAIDDIPAKKAFIEQMLDDLS